MRRLSTCLILLFFCLCMWFCNTKKSKDADNSSPFAFEDDHEKSQIKAFWQFYRLAQKERIAGNWESAKDNYIKALEIDSLHEDSWFNLGNVHLEIGSFSKARDCWLHIVEVNPNSARAHMQLGRLYLSYELPEIFNLAEAKKEFQKTSSINKVVTGPLMLLGHVALIEGEDRLAEEFFKSVIGSDTKNSEACFLLGYIAWKNKLSAEAMEYFNFAINYAKPETAVKGVLSEGDTKDSKSYLRPINESLFHLFFSGLNQVKKEEVARQMQFRYSQMELKLNEIKKEF